MRVRCRCGKFAKYCDGCGNLPEVEKQLLAEVRRLEMRIEVLKRSVKANERAEKLAFDDYEKMREKRDALKRETQTSFSPQQRADKNHEE